MKLKKYNTVMGFMVPPDLFQPRRDADAASEGAEHQGWAGRLVTLCGLLRRLAVAAAGCGCWRFSCRLSGSICAALKSLFTRCFIAPSRCQVRTDSGFYKSLYVCLIRELTSSEICFMCTLPDSDREI